VREFKREAIYAYLAKLDKIKHNESSALLLHWHFGKEISIQMYIEYVKEYEGK
jgi:hypothetical protein